MLFLKGKKFNIFFFSSSLPSVCLSLNLPLTCHTLYPSFSTFLRLSTSLHPSFFLFPLLLISISCSLFLSISRPIIYHSFLFFLSPYLSHTLSIIHSIALPLSSYFFFLVCISWVFYYFSFFISYTMSPLHSTIHLELSIRPSYHYTGLKLGILDLAIKY